MGAKEVVLAGGDDENAADIEDGDRVDEEDEDEDDDEQEDSYKKVRMPIGLDGDIEVSNNYLNSQHKRRAYIEDADSNSTPPP